MERRKESMERKRDKKKEKEKEREGEGEGEGGRGRGGRAESGKKVLKHLVIDRHNLFIVFC